MTEHNPSERRPVRDTRSAADQQTDQLIDQLVDQLIEKLDEQKNKNNRQNPNEAGSHAPDTLREEDEWRRQQDPSGNGPTPQCPDRRGSANPRT
jgi:hypothetical protein